MKFNILITSASRKISLINAFNKGLRDLSLGGSVYASDSSPLAASLYKTKHYVISPNTNDRHYLTWLADFCADNKIRLIIPTRDEELFLFAKIRNKFLAKGIYINISSPDTIDICRDKQKFYNFCKEREFPIPNIYKMLRDIKFPCFIKGRFGGGSRFAFKIANMPQLKPFIPKTKDYIIQEYIGWPECTIDYFADFEGRPVSAVPRERLLTFGGESFIGRTLNDRFLIDSVINFAKALNLAGHNTIQLFFNKKEKKVKFTEVNPRYGGGAILSITAGANTPLFLIKLALNQPIKYRISDFKEDLYMLRYIEDIFVSIDKLKK